MVIVWRNPKPHAPELRNKVSFSYPALEGKAFAVTNYWEDDYQYFTLHTNPNLKQDSGIAS